MRLCYRKCDVESLKKVEAQIKSDLPKCKNTKNPNKCRNKLFKELLKVKQNMVKSELKLKQYLRTHK